MAGIGWAISAIIATTGTAVSAVQSRKQFKRTKKAQKVQRAVEGQIQSSRAARERRSAVSEAILARSGIQNVAAATGQGGSSAPIVAGGSVAGQAGRTVSTINTNVRQANLLTAAQENIFEAANAPPSFGTQLIGNVATNIGNRATGAIGEAAGKKISSIF